MEVFQNALTLHFISIFANDHCPQAIRKDGDLGLWEKLVQHLFQGQ